jgi:uncharacterized protein YajQ (UPF0234 family)
MPTFDVTCEANPVEIRNAVDQANKEIANRFDFKGSDARLELAERQLVAYADDDFKLGQVRDVLLAKLAKRSVDVRFLDHGTPERIGGDRLRQPITIRHGVDAEAGRRIVRTIKDAKLKVQASIQGDAVRVTGAKRDDLQAAIALIRRTFPELPLGFGNFRD